MDDILSTIKKAENALQKWRRDAYVFGFDVLKCIGEISKHHHGSQVIIVATEYEQDKEYWLTNFLNEIKISLKKNHIDINCIVEGAHKDAPYQDIYRIKDEIVKSHADIVIGIGGGSTLDAVKVANALAVAGGNICDYYEKNSLTKQIEKKTVRPFIAVQTAASSGAENTKIALVLDEKKEEKNRINDNLLLPAASVFDFRTTLNSPMELTIDGAIDSLSHLWEEMLGSVGRSIYGDIEELFISGSMLIFSGLPRVLKNPNDILGRKALSLAACRGSHALMYHRINKITKKEVWGSTNCGHFHSYQIPKYATHGRICGILFPYYTALMALNINRPCATIAEILKRFGYMNDKVNIENNRLLALSVTKGIHQFYKTINFPLSLSKIGVPFSEIDKMIEKTHHLPAICLKDMPVPMTSEDIDKYILPTLKAAYKGRLEQVPTIPV